MPIYYPPIVPDERPAVVERYEQPPPAVVVVPLQPIGRVCACLNGMFARSCCQEMDDGQR